MSEESNMTQEFNTSHELDLSQTHTPQSDAASAANAEPRGVPTITTTVPTTPPAPKTTDGLSEIEQAKVDRILEYKSKIDILIGNVRDTKRLCEKYDSENQYLQDYIGTLMSSGEIKK